MTYIEFQENIKKLKHIMRNCNLIEKDIYNSKHLYELELGLWVYHNKDVWEVYHTERGSAELACIFYTETALYEGIYSYLKKFSDEECWLVGMSWEYPQNIIKRMKKFKISESEYSFESKMRENCVCIEQKEMIETGELSQGILRNKDGIKLFDISLIEKNGDKVDVWEVYYNDGVERTTYGVFLKKWDAYDFCFYLVMKKHVSVKKRWW